jgi:hypothetical protein
VRKAADVDHLSKFFPAVGLFEVVENVYELYAVEGVVGLLGWGGIFHAVVIGLGSLLVQTSVTLQRGLREVVVGYPGILLRSVQGY